MKQQEIDIRIDASDTAVDLEVADVDLALRYGPMATMPQHAVRLFGEQLTPVASPWLLKKGSPKKPADLAPSPKPAGNPRAPRPGMMPPGMMPPGMPH